MTENRGKNNPLYFIVGLMLCLLCITGIGVLIYALVSTSAEKSRLESIGATVTMKFTWLFFADIIVIIVSGITGAYLLGKRKGTNREPISETLFTADLTHAETPSAEPVIPQDKPTVPSSSSNLHINYGGSGRKSVAGDVGVSVHVDKPSKPKESGFFSSGEDL